MMHLAVAALLTLAQNNDKAQANGYDDGWKTGWTNHCRSVLGTGPKTTGFVLHVGDSITFSSAYGAWIKGGTNRTTEDLAIINWFNNFSVPGGIDAASTNGLYLANKDSPSSGRSFTAAGGIDTAEYLSGSNNGAPAMPAISDPATARTTLSSGYNGTLQIDTVAAAFSAAQVAVLMLGTNDVNGSRSAANFIADLATIVTKLEFQHIVVVLSTIPPHASANATVIQYNTAIRNYAQSHGLPLIDLYAEFLARQPSNWANTLIDGGYHPTGDRAGYTLTSDIYAGAGGNATTHKTGPAAAEVGYLLRTWLTVQKLKEVRAFVVEGQTPVLANPAAPAPGPGPGPSPSPSPSTPTAKNSGGDDSKCGGSIDGPVSPWMLVGTALAALALLAATRKTGV